METYNHKHHIVEIEPDEVLVKSPPFSSNDIKGAIGVVIAPLPIMILFYGNTLLRLVEAGLED